MHGLAVAAQSPAGSQAAPADPPGLSVVWRLGGRKIDPAFAWSRDAFSADGRLVAIADATGARVLDASSGAIVRRVAADWSRDPAYSIAISRGGALAVGRLGQVELYRAAAEPAARYPCEGLCGPIGAVAFSPNGALLAYQAARSLDDRQRGLGAVNVVATADAGPIRRLDAIAARAQLAFSADGRTLLAANASSIDDAEWHGVRAWSTRDWQVQLTLAGTHSPARTVGTFGAVSLAAAYERNGALELNDLATGKVLWSVPLVTPAFDSATPGSSASTLDFVQLAPNGTFVVSYESPIVRGRVRTSVVGTIVVRRASDGAIEALYDAPGVLDLRVAPDSKTFLYSTGAGALSTVLARVPF